LRASLLISLILHGAILGAAVIGFVPAEHRSITPTQIAVSVLTPADLTTVKAGQPDAKAEEAAKRAPPPVEKPEPVAESAAKLPPSDKLSNKQAALPAPKPKAPPPQDSPEVAEKTAAQPETPPAPPPPAEKPAPARTAAAKSPERAKPRQETARRDEPRPKPEQVKEPPEPRARRRQEPERDAAPADKRTLRAEGRSEFDPDRIAALLNRDPTAGGSVQEDEPREPWRRPSTLEDQANGVAPDEAERIAYGAREGRDASMSSNEIDAFRAQISRCWTPPVGGLGGDAIIVKLRIALNEDGSLTRAPEIDNDLASPFFRPAADSAVRAVMQCQPYRMPPEKYGQWRDMLLTFDPRRMYGG
jgi:hypothetical protein